MITNVGVGKYQPFYKKITKKRRQIFCINWFKNNKDGLCHIQGGYKKLTQVLKWLYTHLLQIPGNLCLPSVAE